MYIWLTINFTVNNANRWHQLAINKFEFYYTLHEYPIDFVLGYYIAAAPDPARDYWCANCSIEETSNLI